MNAPSTQLDIYRRSSCHLRKLASFTGLPSSHQAGGIRRNLMNALMANPSLMDF